MCMLLCAWKRETVECSTTSLHASIDDKNIADGYVVYYRKNNMKFIGQIENYFRELWPYYTESAKHSNKSITMNGCI